MDVDPLSRALHWIDGQEERRQFELNLLREVRSVLTRIAGQGKPDGWAQIGHPGDE